MSDTTQDPQQEPDGTQSGRDNDRYIPSADQDVASGQPYDPRQDPPLDPDTESEDTESDTESETGQEEKPTEDTDGA